ELTEKAAHSPCSGAGYDLVDTCEGAGDRPGEAQPVYFDLTYLKLRVGEIEPKGLNSLVVILGSGPRHRRAVLRLFDFYAKQGAIVVADAPFMPEISDPVVKRFGAFYV